MRYPEKAPESLSNPRFQTEVHSQLGHLTETHQTQCILDMHSLRYMHYPHVTFHKSTKRDFDTLHAFIKDAEYDNGRNLDWAVFHKYPRLKTQFDKNKHYKMKDGKMLRHFVYETYHTKQTAMNLALANHRRRWMKIAPHYFSLIDTLFGGRKWPNGKYIAFGTIWGMYPRFLKDKIFQIPFWHRTPRYIPVVIAHELLHFIFYDYFYTRYPQYQRPKDNFFVWHVSEIFNTIIQNSPVWLDCFKLKSLGYPKHKTIVAHISSALYRRDEWNLNTLVDKIIKEVRNQKLAL